MANKETARIGEGKRGPGRPKGSLNRTTALLKDAILKAAEAAGENLHGEGDGLQRYLQAQAIANPGPYLTLLGKVLPLQIAGKLEMNHRTKEQRDAAVAAASRANG